MGAGIGESKRDAYYVITLQEALQMNGYPVPMNGVFDSKTYAMLKKFQAEHGLVSDGIAGKNTFRLLKIGPYRPRAWYQQEIFEPLRPEIDPLVAHLPE